MKYLRTYLAKFKWRVPHLSHDSRIRLDGNFRPPFKNYYNYAIDFLLAYGFLVIIVSSYALWFILPMGQGLGGMTTCPLRLTGMGDTGNSILFFGIPRFLWVEIHSWVSVVVISLILLHMLSALAMDC
jgi:hypothetical protein